jgi:membrane-associated phospholipid phosphatase
MANGSCSPIEGGRMSASALRCSGFGSIARLARAALETQDRHLARIATASAVFAAAAVIASRVGQPGPLADADRIAFAAVRVRRHAAGVLAARCLSALAEPGVTYPAAVLTGLALSGRTSWRHAAAPLLAISSGAVVRRRVSQIVARPRPPSAAWLAEPEGFSLPSKHTTQAALTAGACARALSPQSRGYAASTVAAVLVGGSRVYLGVHWPGDAVTGWLFAVGWLRLTDPR